ncbi:MAG: glycosyltransferase family 39 protein [Anaerolineae bacterium]|nr:glycosyltransferase family 39 protein [Anaerolineae bacterium]
MNLSAIWKNRAERLPVVWRRIVVAGAFLLFLVGRWGHWDLFVPPAYGDPLEVVWGIRWYHEALTGAHDLLFTDRVFHPEGWHVGTFPYSPYLLLAGALLYPLIGAGLFYNIVALAALLLAYTGTYLVARQLVGAVLATFAAVGYVFVFPVFWRAFGHLNVLGGLAALPWLLWAIWRTEEHDHSLRWLLVLGLIWGLAITSSFYFIFIGGLLIVLAVRWRPQPFRNLSRLLFTAFVAFLFNLPHFVLYIVARHADAVAFVAVSDINYWGMSANSVISPSLFHPYLGGVARHMYSGSRHEPAVMSFGVVAPLVALGSVRWLRHSARLRALWLLAIAGTLLALGPYLKWDGKVIGGAWFAPVNEGIWRVGNELKPGLFPENTAPPPLDSAVPLPELALLAVVPLWEGVRVPARFAYLAVLAIPLLAAFTLSRLRRTWLVVLLALLWLVEVVPSRQGTSVAPLEPHPAHTWLANQVVAAGEGVVDVRSDSLITDPAIMLATDYHGLPTASGISSQWPAHSRFLNRWYAHYGLESPDLAYVLQRFQIRYLLLHVQSAKDRAVQPFLDAAPGLAKVNCFEPSSRPSPWAYPICIYEVEPIRGNLDLVLQDGWNIPEDWGVWAANSVASANWVALEAGETTLTVDALPYCGSIPQSMRVSVGEVVVGETTWHDCESKQLQWTIPSSALQVGWNSLTFYFDRALVPAEVSGGANLDPRPLAVGFSRLELEPAR